MRRSSFAGAVTIALLAASCSGGSWSEDDKQDFLNDCLTNLRLKNEKLRSAICNCWLTRTQEQYSLAEVNGNDPAISSAFVQLGKDCSEEHGMRASLPGEVPTPPSP